jgi:hypothetical protein
VGPVVSAVISLLKKDSFVINRALKVSITSWLVVG